MVSWEGRRVLVTGASGFIGDSLCQRLVLEGAEVFGLFRSLDMNSMAHHVMGDVCDYDSVRRAISYNEIDTIYHFAAYAIVRVASRDPVSTYQVNVMGTVNVLEAARSVGNIRNVIVASSDKAYGDHEELPYVESHSLVPKNTYDTSKACMDMIAHTYGENYGLPVAITRCSNVYGPGDENISRLVPNTIRRCLNGDPPQIYSDVSEMEREFIFIDDVVDAYVKLGTHTCVPGEAFNIGGTGHMKIKDFVSLISEMTGCKKPPEIIQRERNFKEIQKQYIDASKLRLQTGWEPEVNLSEGIARTIDWYRDPI